MKLKTLRLAVIAYVLFDVLIGGYSGGLLPLTTLAAAQNSSTQALINAGSFGQGEYYAPAYSYNTTVFSGGSTAGGSYSVQVFKPFVVLPDKRAVLAFSITAPITIGSGATKETVTPSAVSSGCLQLNTGVGSASCSITATFTNAHGQGDIITSGSFGLQEAINDAQSHGGGVVNVDSIWTAIGGTNTILAAAVPFSGTSVMDLRGTPQFWNPQGGATTLAAPATLTAVTALPSAAPVGAFGTGTYHLSIAYVDIMGQEGPASADFSEAGLATGSFIFSPPAASAGAVGYTIYIGLTGGGVTNLNYKVPLTAAVCGGALTSLETITAACPVANTTYGQAGATATVTAITVNTSPIAPAVTVVSTTSVYVPNAGGRTTYAYVPGSRIGAPGIVSGYLPFTISAADATTVPSVLGTTNVGPGFMNYVGRTLEICGRATTTATTATTAHIQFQLDAFGQNTAGKGVVIGDLALTPATAFATTAVYSFCETFMTTASGATATSGSILPIGGYLNTSGVSAAAAGQGGGADAASLGAVASLNLASEARLNVIYVHTTGTDGAALTLQSLTAKIVN